MVSKKQNLLIGLLPLLVLPTFLSISGCGNNGLIKEDPVVKAKAEKAGTDIHTYFMKANGNYDSLTAVDKADLNAITGSEAHSRTAFSKIGGIMNAQTSPGTHAGR